MSVGRFLLGVILMALMLAFLFTALAMGVTQFGANLFLARAEHVEAQALLQQARTIDYLARQQAAYSNRLFVGVAVLGLMVLGGLALALVVIVARDAEYRRTLMYLNSRPVQQALPPANWITPQPARQRQEMRR